MDHQPSRMMRVFSSQVPADEPGPPGQPGPGPGPGPGWPGDFDVLDPRPAQIHLVDIAHGLAGRFRFAGQSPIRKTVALHSLEVADRCAAPMAKVWGLFHDSAEAYLGDFPRPHKHLLRMGIGPRCVPIAEIEAMLLEVIAQRFHLPWPIPADLAAEIKAADDACLAAEQATLWGRPSYHPTGQIDLDKVLWLDAATGAVAEMARIHAAEHGGY